MVHKHTPKYMQLTENGSPATPPAGHISIYPKTNGLWYQLDENGREIALGSSVVVRERNGLAVDASDLKANTLTFPRSSVLLYAANTAQVDVLQNPAKRTVTNITVANNATINTSPFASYGIFGTLAASIQTDSYYTLMTSTAVIGNTAGVYYNGTSGYSALWQTDPIFECVMRTSTAVTSCRMWVGLASAVPPNADTLTTGTAVTFRYNGTGGWTPVVYNGTTQTTGTTIGTVAVSTRYVLRIRVVGSNAYFSVNDSAEQVVSTNVPTTGLAGAQCAVIATTAAARAIAISRMYVENGT